MKNCKIAGLQILEQGCLQEDPNQYIANQFVKGLGNIIKNTDPAETGEFISGYLEEWSKKTVFVVVLEPEGCEKGVLTYAFPDFTAAFMDWDNMEFGSVDGLSLFQNMLENMGDVEPSEVARVQNG